MTTAKNDQLSPLAEIICTSIGILIAALLVFLFFYSCFHYYRPLTDEEVASYNRQIASEKLNPRLEVLRDANQKKIKMLENLIAKEENKSRQAFSRKLVTISRVQTAIYQEGIDRLQEKDASLQSMMIDASSAREYLAAKEKVSGWGWAIRIITPIFLIIGALCGGFSGLAAPPVQSGITTRHAYS